MQRLSKNVRVFDRLKIDSFIVVGFFVMAFVSFRSTADLRYILDWRWLYKVGVIIGLACHVSAFVFSIINVIRLIQYKVVGLNKRLLWIGVSAIPVLFIVCTIMLLYFKENV